MKYENYNYELSNKWLETVSDSLIITRSIAPSLGDMLPILLRNNSLFSDIIIIIIYLQKEL